MLRWLTCLISLLSSLAALPAAAADFPSQPVRIVVPFPPGGGTDVVARSIADKLGPALGVQVLVDNRPVGNSVIASRHVAGAGLDVTTGSAADPEALVRREVERYRRIIALTGAKPQE